jgi:hypothetical protein
MKAGDIAKPFTSWSGSVKEEEWGPTILFEDMPSISEDVPLHLTS